MKSNFKVILFYVVIISLIFLFANQVLNPAGNEPLTYGEIVGYFEKDQVKAFQVSKTFFLKMEVYVAGEDGLLTYDDAGNITNTTKIIGTKLGNEIDKNNFYRLFFEKFYKNANLVAYNFEPTYVSPWWLELLVPGIIIVVVVGIWFYFMNQAVEGRGGKASSFGKARVKVPSTNEKDKVTFKDVAGADEEKAELVEIVEYLKDPAKFSRLGAKIPHGVLLVGPPGTGKTLLAKAVAGEAGVPFFSISGSDFVEMYVGVGASRVRDLFENARKSNASIIFIDEIDAVGRHRGAGLGGGHDEREQTLNQLLVEMDGFGSHDGIIVIAATNRPDILDPALLRPGRFDRQVTVSYPDIKGREEILRVHSRKKPLGPDVDLAKIAQSTAGFTGADLANLLNEAALLAARRGKSLIDNSDLEDSFIKVIAGPKKTSMRIKDSEKKNTAYHEAGHAIASYRLPHLDGNVHQISIIPSGKALGYTMTVPSEDKYSVYREELKEKICELLAGRVAEEIIFGDISGGASNDIERATDIARNMVTKLGMSDLIGPINYSSGHSEVFLGRSFSESSNFSEDIAAKIDSEIHRIISEAHNRTRDLLRENIDKLHFIAGYLIKNEVMDAEQFKAVMDGNPTIEEIEEIAAEKKRRREEADAERARQNSERKETERREKEAQRAREAAAQEGKSDDGTPPASGGVRH